jgi:hypothetical protein
MTLCIGCTDTEAASLTADSAVTVPRRAMSTEYSTFGEKQPQTTFFNVEESALKILRHGETAAAFAGDASPIMISFTTTSMLHVSGLPERRLTTRGQVHTRDEIWKLCSPTTMAAGRTL